MSTQELIKYLDQHSIFSRIAADGKIHAHAVYCKDGKSFVEVEVIDPTFKAVREWLGY